jgi:hypothetical protein
VQKRKRSTLRFLKEEDHGLANQGKPSKLVAYLIPVLLIA